MKSLLFLSFSLFSALFASAASPSVKAGRFGLIQYNGDIHFGNRQTNTKNLTTLALQAVSNGAKIIVTPEGATYGYAHNGEVWCAPENIGPDGYFVASQRTHESVANRPVGIPYNYTGIKENLFKMKCKDVSTAAEAIPSGPTSQYWIQFAKQHQIYMLYQVPEVENGKYYVSMGIAGPNGFVTKYRKRALYWVDEAYASPGKDQLILETEYGNFGLLICRDATKDSHFYDDYIKAGVDGIILSMNWDDDPNDPVISARASFQKKSATYNVDIFASDVSPWDGTAAYLKDFPLRQRQHGLPDASPGQDGVVYQDINYDRCKKALK